MKNFRFYTLLALLIMMSGTMKAQQWEIDYGDSFSYTSLYQGIINADGDAIVMGVWGEDKNHYRPMTMQVDMEGNYDIHTFEDEQFNMFYPSDFLQMENGNYFVVGIKESALVAVVFDSNFNVINVKAYEKPEIAISLGRGSLLLDDDGTMVFSGGYNYQDVYGQRTKPYFYRFDENADTLSSRFVTAELPHPEATIYEYDCFQLLKNPKSDGFVVLCNGLGNVCSLLKYDNNFSYEDGFKLIPAHPQHFENAYSGHWLSDDKLFVMGYMWPYQELTEWNIGLAEIGLDGTFDRFERVYYKQDTAVKAPPKCMAYVNDTTMYGITHIFQNVLSGPYYTGVFLFDKDMEVLGKREFYEPEYENHVTLPGFIIPLPDGGCLFNAEVSTLFLGDYTYGKLIKMRREDFNPIPCSVKEVPQEAIKVYPNPTNGTVTIDGLEVAEVKVYNILGQLVKETKENVIDLSAQEAGTYILKVITPSGVVTKQIIKN